MTTCSGSTAGEQREELAMQFGSRTEASVGIEVVAEEAVARTGNVSANRVEGFVLATKAIRTARVNQTEALLVEVAAYRLAAHYPVPQIHLQHRWHETRQIGHQGPAFCQPAIDATVEHRHAIVSEPTQQPPQTTGKSASGVVIGDDLRLGRDARLAQPVGEKQRIGQGVPPITAIHRSREIPIQMQKAGPRQMSGSVGPATGLRISQEVAAIKDAPARIVQVTREDGRADQG
jgi:hypothetical protein